MKDAVNNELRAAKNEVTKLKEEVCFIDEMLGI